MNILLVEPDFPYPTKSKHRANEIHKNFVPIGLLKLGAWRKSSKDKVKLVRGLKDKKELDYFNPNQILITSIFTYWSHYIWDTVKHYRGLFPKSKILIGGIYVTLHHNYPEFRKLVNRYKANIHVGLHEQAEKFLPDYTLLYSDTEYHLMHGMRGCIRRCKFCGTWRVEPRLMFKKPAEIVKEIIDVGKNKVIFLDNNYFANPFVKDTLKELAKIIINGKPVIFECQSGFDGRLLAKDPELAILLKKARFNNIRIAWDHGIGDAKLIKKQLDYLIKAGYFSKDISVFMIYNFDIPHEEMLKKLNYCKKWNVQIADCRYRPLDSVKDNFKPNMFKKGQTEEDYYIHKKAGWSDRKIRDFRKRVRQHNIEVRYGHAYNKKMEWWSSIHHLYKFFSLDRPPQYKKIEKSKLLLRRIILMKQASNICKKYNLQPLNLGNPSKKNINKKLEKFIKVYTNTFE